MKRRDSLFVFALLALLCMTTSALGQTTKSKPTVQAQSIAPQSTIALGRYQIVINPNVKADTFLLDTQTGMVWVHAEITDLEGNPTVWKLMDRVDSEQEFIEWGARLTPKKQAQPH